jgi:Zn-dependent protease/predicted transcriptional regulator
VRGIQIIIDYSWFIIFFLVMYTMAESYFPQAQGQFTKGQYWIMGLVSATLLFASVLLHELAHSFVALKHGIQVTSIRLFIFGGVAQVSSEPSSGRHEFLIALSGPATSMALAFFFAIVYGFLALTGLWRPAEAVAWYLLWANVLLAFFNMIPGFPLDGGRILRAILWDRWDDMARATKVVSQIGNAFALFMIVLGILQFFFTQSLISGLWFIFIGLFMKQSAVGSYHAVVLKKALSGVPIRQIMTENVVTVDWLVSLEDLVREFIYRYHFTNFPVFDREEFVGMVSLGQVKTIAKELWAFKQVRDIMTPVELVASLRPTDDATEALARMITDDLGRMPVVEDGRLVGIVSRRDIMNLFKIKSDLGLA